MKSKTIRKELTKHVILKQTSSRDDWLRCFCMTMRFDYTYSQHTQVTCTKCQSTGRMTPSLVTKARKHKAKSKAQFNTFHYIL